MTDDLLEAYPDGVVVTDRNGRVLYANPAASRLLGAALDLSPRPELEVREVEVRFEGAPARLHAIRDVRDRRQRDEADRLRELGELAARVAHDVNNPATFVLANLELIKRRIVADAELARMVDDAIEGMLRIRTLIRDLGSRRSDDEPVEQSPPGRRARVLLVDDEPLVLRAISRALAPAHEVVVAEGGRAALAVLEQDHAFDAILCDLSMPDVDGPTLLDEVHRRWGDLSTRVVFVAGEAFTPRLRDFAARTPNLVLQKPVSLHALRGAIAHMLG